MLITKMFNMAWKKKSVWEKKEKISLKSLHFFLIRKEKWLKILIIRVSEISHQKLTLLIFQKRAEDSFLEEESYKICVVEH